MDSTNFQQQDPPNRLAPAKLWAVGNSVTNFAVWRVQVCEMLCREGELSFIDGNKVPPPKTVVNLADGTDMENPDYQIWRESDFRVKQKLLSLLDQGVTPSDVDQKTCRDIWLELEWKFQPLFSPTTQVMASPNIHEQQDQPHCRSIRKLWLIDETVTNFVVWRAQVLDMLQDEGLIGFIDETNLPPLKSLTDNTTVIMNPDYLKWRKSDLVVKEKLLSLLDKTVTPTEMDRKTGRDIWLDLEYKFNPLIKSSTPGSEHKLSRKSSALVQSSRSTKYMNLLKNALLGNKWAAKHMFQSDVGAMIKNLRVMVHSPEIVLANDDTLIDITLDQDLDFGGVFPVPTAPIYNSEDIFKYLIDEYKSSNPTPTPYVLASRLALLLSAIDAGFYSIASGLVKSYPYLARVELYNKSALKCLASKKLALRDPEYDYFGECGPFSCICKALPPYPTFSGSAPESFLGHCYSCLCTFALFIGVYTLIRMLIRLPWELLKVLGFLVGNAQETKSNGYEEGPLIVELCNAIGKDSSQVEEIYNDAIRRAARAGKHHVVMSLIRQYSESAVLCCDPASSKYLSHMAVEIRSQEILRLVYDKCTGKNGMLLSLDMPDMCGNNLLHLAAKLSPPDVLHKIPGAIFQMQHDIKWYKGIETLLCPNNRQKLNNDGKSPKMIFIEEHKELKEQAEKWVKDTATTSTIIAVLISTIMFAAAITVPGGTNGNTGFPMLLGNNIFILFAVSDALSLITSSTSLLIFMDVMVSHFQEEDFLHRLPVGIIIGGGTLLVSIMSMMLTFSTTLYLVFGQQKLWVLICVIAIAWYIVVLFVYLQGSLLRHLISSTYSEDIVPKSLRDDPSDEHSPEDLLDYLM